jgi:NADH-quinone oxidoreductase subunit J
MFYKLSIITFWIFLIPLGISCATAVVFFQNTLYIAFNFIIILTVAAAIVFCLKAEFLAYTILIVYIGAIAILFLFVIMMLNLNLTSLAVFSTWELCIAFFLVVKVLLVSKVMLIPAVLSYLGKGLIWPNFWDKSNIALFGRQSLFESSLYSPTTQIEILAQLLYVDFYYLFLIVGIILLVAMVVALVLTTSKNLLEK